MGRNFEPLKRMLETRLVRQKAAFEETQLQLELVEENERKERPESPVKPAKAG